MSGNRSYVWPRRRLGRLPRQKARINNLLCCVAFFSGSADFRIKKGSRLEQIAEWLKGDPAGGLIILDECHKAKNLVAGGGKKEGANVFVANATQTGRAVAAIQWALPKAYVLYSSATGASEPANMHYMLR